MSARWDDLRAKAQAATPGEWQAKHYAESNTPVVCGPDHDMGGWTDAFVVAEPKGMKQKENATYIAAASPAAVLDLLAERDALLAALLRWQHSGCPDCSGDCGSANPPVMCCIMQETRAALAKATGGAA